MLSISELCVILLYIYLTEINKMNYDICSLGSALVDVTFQIDDEFSKKIEGQGIPKGAMTLIDKDDQRLNKPRIFAFFTAWPFCCHISWHK